MLTGNKGEWSEIYVFLKLLADGRSGGTLTRRLIIDSCQRAGQLYA